MSIAGRIRFARRTAGYSSQSALARKLGWTTSRLSNYEQGLRAPDVQALDELARVMGVSLQWLATGEGPAPTVAQGVSDDSAGRVSSGSPESQAAQASESVRLDDDRLERAVRFLERQFALFDREFVASDHIRLIARVYERIGKPKETNLVHLSQWLITELDGEDGDNGREQRRRRSGES